MGAWSAEPFGNDTAADWAWELEESSDWTVVAQTLQAALSADEPIDSDIATTAIAAAEVVAHGLGRPTQDDPYTEAIDQFVGGAPAPSPELVELALSGLAAATRPTSELTELWAEADARDWEQAIARIEAALRN